MPKDKKPVDPLAPRASKVTKSTKKPHPSTKNLPNKPYKSAELITESDDEDEEMQAAPAATPAVVNANGASASSSDEDEDEEDDDEESEDEASNKVTPKKQGKQPAQEEVDDEDDDEEDENEDDELPENPVAKAISSSSKAPKASKAIASSSKSTAPVSGRIDNDITDEQLRPTVAFNAPSGFKPMKEDAISTRTDLFRPKNTKDKEIWYISAPASLPITALKEVALEKFAKQQAIMTHNGESYTLVSDPAVRDTTRVLLPEGKRGYKVISTPVKHVLQFQQILSVQATASKGRPKTTSQVLLDTDLPTKPAKKAQPTGLKMRFRPSGFGDGHLGHIGSSDEEDLPDLPAFRHPPCLESGKRKEPASETSPEKSEKKKKSKDKCVSIMTPDEVAQKNETYVEEATTAIDADQATAPEEAVSKEGKKKKKKDRQGVETATGMEPAEEPVNGEPIPVDEASPAPDESKKAKKEKKKKRKEAEADARAINGTAEEPQAVAAAEDEISEKKRRKKEKKEKKAKREACEL